MEGIELLAQNYFGNTRDGSLAGPIGAFIVAALAVVTVLLIRNMSRRIRRLPNEFPGQSRSEDHVEVSENSDSGRQND